MLTGTAVGAATLLVGSGVWVRSSTSTAVDADVPLAVAGSVAAPGVTAGGLVVLAAALALALVGRWGRWVTSAAVVLGGVLVVAASVAVRADPAPVALSAARATVGVGSLSGPVTVSALVWVAAGLGALAVAVGLRTAVVGRTWERPSARHDPAAVRPVEAAAATDDQAAWDALTRGEDPSDLR